MFKKDFRRWLLCINGRIYGGELLLYIILMPSISSSSSILRQGDDEETKN